jgi:colanic acid/amylovoran biosynthesis glycosyltransferase
VGYGSAYPRELISAHGGGRFVSTGDIQALSDALIELHRDRTELSTAVSAAAASGRLLDRDSAIQHRVDLIKKYAGI